MRNVFALCVLMACCGCGETLADQRMQKKTNEGSVAGLPLFNGSEPLEWKQVADGVKAADTFYYNLQTRKDFEIVLSTPVPSGIKLKGQTGESQAQLSGQKAVIDPDKLGRHGIIIGLSDFEGNYKGPYLITLQKPTD